MSLFSQNAFFPYLNPTGYLKDSETCEKILNILKGLEPSKAAGIDNLSG